MLRDEIVKLIKDDRLSYYGSSESVTDAILALPEMVAMKEKAEKWDKFPNFLAKGEKLALLMDRLMVREKCNECPSTFPCSHKDSLGRSTLNRSGKCPKCAGTGYQDFEVPAVPCSSCHGTGFVERAARPEEVREFLEWLNNKDGELYNEYFYDNFTFTRTGKLGYVLKSGDTLFIKEEV